MSVFQDEIGDDGQQYAHLQAAAAQQQNSVGSSVSTLAQPIHASPVSPHTRSQTPKQYMCLGVLLMSLD